MLLGRRGLLIGLGASCATTWLPRPASASVALPLSLTELVQTSTYALVAIARDASSNWEDDGHGKRIVTYTRLEAQQPLDGRSSPNSDVYVRTLGGEVGDIGQIVQGEAEIQRNVPAVFFLRDSLAGVFAVTGMAQGHYALRADREGTHRLLPGRNLNEEVLADPMAAVARLRDKTLVDCEHLIVEEMRPR
jgi:hypothetical protein